MRITFQNTAVHKCARISLICVANEIFHIALCLASKFPFEASWQTSPTTTAQFGIEDFQIDARKVEGGTEVHLSGYLNPDIQFRYGVSTFDKVNTFRLRYRLAHQVFVEGISGVENAVDFLYSFER